MQRKDDEASKTLFDTPFKIPFLRALYSFPGETSLEQYSSLTILPGQLSRVLGFPLGTAMRAALGESGWKQMQYGLAGQHRLSETSRAVVAKPLGPLGPPILEAMDTGTSEMLDNSSPWDCFPLQLTGPRDALNTGLERACAYLSSLEKLRSAASQRSVGYVLSQEWLAFHEFASESVSEWGTVLGSTTLKAAPLLTSTLHALAELDVGVGAFLGNKAESWVGQFLEGQHRPLTHWIHGVQAAYGVTNNQALADKLLAKRIWLVKGGVSRPITRATLAKWARGDQLARPGAVQVLLAALADQQKMAALTTEYFVARGLLFLVQAVGGLSRIELSPAEAQYELRTRYLATFEQVASQHESAF